ncbi:MAG: hypothetical protein MJ149_01755 [Clostridia bacterium]|nr:hypothetical protein [Clostridia bacterium]
MKKFGAILLTLLAAFTCFIFSACGSKYANLSMQFLTEDGEEVENVELTLDAEDPTAPNQIKLAIKVSGVAVEDVGLIDVKSEPAGLVSVSTPYYNQEYCYVTVTALESCRDSAKLVAMHLSSGKTTSIPLFIGEKAKDVAVTPAYIVAIPTEGEK